MRTQAWLVPDAKRLLYIDIDDLIVLHLTQPNRIWQTHDIVVVLAMPASHASLKTVTVAVNLLLVKWCFLFSTSKNAHRDDSIQVPSGDRQQFVIKRSLPNWIFAFIVSTIGASNSWKWKILLGKWVQGSNWETLMSSGCCFKNHSSSLTDCQSVDFSKLLRLIISEKMDCCFQLIWNCQHFIYRRNAYSASRFQGNNRSTP